MALISQQAKEARQFFTSEFASSYPSVFKSLQDFAVAGSGALKNNGRRAWFGLGRDLSLESARKYQDSIVLLLMSCERDEFLTQPAIKQLPKVLVLDQLVQSFFTAYPNWPDAEAAWDVVGQKTMNELLRSRGY